MKKLYRVGLAIIILGMSALACGLPGGQNQPSPTEDASSAVDQVATVVASTMQALTPNTSNPPVAETAVPSSSDLLPFSLYFLNNDSAGIAQIFRLGVDGKSLTQVTFEPTAVSAYDVSFADGSIAYIANNQLLLIQADGSGRRTLVDGGPSDPNNPFITNIRNPVFSPDGQTVAFGYQGLNFYSLVSGVSNRVLDDQIDDLGNDLLVVREAYSPEKYSPDGTKLLITLQYYEGASSAIYYPAANSLVRLTNDGGAFICCGEPEWTPDNSALFVGNPSMGMFSSGLWRVDAANGTVTTLLPGESNGTFNFADEAFLAPDNQLYFFYASLPAPQDFVTRSPLQLVRSAADGVTGRTVLRPENFQLMNEAIWAPDASFVIVANAPIDQVYQGGLIELYYTDAQKEMISLVPFGQLLKWGP